MKFAVRRITERFRHFVNMNVFGARRKHSERYVKLPLGIVLGGDFLSLDRRHGFYVDINGIKVFVESFNSTQNVSAKVLCLPGIGNYGWYFGPLASYLNELGIAVYSTDYRGTGLSEGLRWDIPSSEVWIQDIEFIIESLPDKHVPTFLLGHSLGGALALNTVVKVQNKLNGLIVVAPAMTVKPVPLPWTNYLIFPIAMVFAPHRPIVKVPHPSFEDMIRNNADKELAVLLQNNPYQLKKMSARGGLAINRIKKLTNTEIVACNTDLPVLVVCGDNDSALKGAVSYFESLRSNDKELITFSSGHHHLLRVENKVDVYRPIASWIKHHVDSVRLTPKRQHHIT